MRRFIAFNILIVQFLYQRPQMPESTYWQYTKLMTGLTNEAGVTLSPQPYRTRHFGEIENLL